MTIWFTSDLHLGHANIIKYCKRPFKHVDEMDEKIIENWNTLITPQDTVYVLGDFSFSDKPENYFRRLNGCKCLLVGNHDSHEVKKLKWNMVRDTYMLKHQNSLIWLSHYAHRIWPNAHHGAIHLFGHSHGSMPKYGKSFDAGVDVWNYSPISFDQVIEYTKNLEVLGHHSKAD